MTHDEWPERVANFHTSGQSRAPRATDRGGRFIHCDMGSVRFGRPPGPARCQQFFLWVTKQFLVHLPPRWRIIQGVRRSRVHFIRV